ncbi:hypothetical protein RRG08_015340 [Elysia crispata]|uniref:Uncharacterized protein n=1 Tax=Elysia crispata TaxID=231223 RepID=A0AAE1DUP1_9GAST|nr:hypothetical protein RRG08_015340 [Elysia crispata]
MGTDLIFGKIGDSQWPVLCPESDIVTVFGGVAVVHNYYQCNLVFASKTDLNSFHTLSSSDKNVLSNFRG